MCIIVDTCCIPKVFNPADKDHVDFAAVLTWINKDGRILVGGSKYNRELRCMSKFLQLLGEYKKRGKLVRLDDVAVDEQAKCAKKKEPSSKFNDEHIVGMVAISRCRIVCTVDEEAIPYITKKTLYEDIKPPKIYRRNAHRHLLAKKNLVSVCKA